MAHSVFSIVTPIKVGHLETLRRVLAEIQGNQAVNPYLRLPEFDELHFASFVIFVDAEPALLVFENNVDGPKDRYLRRLVEAGSGIDRIYSSCVGYDAAAPPEAKERYLLDHARSPHLYHIGTPYRTARSIRRDGNVRRELDRRLDELMAGSLNGQVAAAPPGQREFSKWEVVWPWYVWEIGGYLLAFLTQVILTSHDWWVGLVSALFRSSSPLLARLAPLLGRLSPAAWRLALFLAMNVWWLVVPVIAGVFLFATVFWLNTRPLLRFWAVSGLAIGAVVPLLWARHGWWVGLLLGVLALSPWLLVRAFVRRRRSDQLQLVRQNARGHSPADLWADLQTLARSRGYRPQPAWTRFGHFLQRLVTNWWPWALAWIVLWRCAVKPLWDSERAVVAAMTALFFLKALFLSVLVGWPQEGRWRWKIVAFISSATVVGFLLVAYLRHVLVPEWVVAAIVLVALLGLWAVPLPSPDIPLQPLASGELDNLTQDEDRFVQNHMAAMVHLRTDRLRIRAIFLRVFLWLLNVVFFRAWLPDVLRGKLFGIPTVHFAQWILLDDRRYLFLSNYDNSWDAYLNDFGAELNSGIQKIWGQGEGNPGTSDLGRFKDYARTVMVRHSVWYSAYQDLTVRQIWNNEKILGGLVGVVNDVDGVDLLGRFGAAPRILNAFSK